MKQWLVKRGDKFLGVYIAEELRLDDEGLYAIRGGRTIGSIASGPNLNWTHLPWPKADATDREEKGE